CRAVAIFRLLIWVRRLANELPMSKVMQSGSSAACSKEAPSRAYPTDKERIVDGWRPGTARLFRARPLQAVGSARPSARISIPQVIPMFYDAACAVHLNTSHVLPTDG